MKYKEIFTRYLITPGRNCRFWSHRLDQTGNFPEGNVNKSQLILRMIKYLTPKIPELGTRAGANDVLENSPEERRSRNSGRKRATCPYADKVED